MRRGIEKMTYKERPKPLGLYTNDKAKLGNMTIVFKYIDSCHEENGDQLMRY